MTAIFCQKSKDGPWKPPDTNILIFYRILECLIHRLCTWYTQKQNRRHRRRGVPLPQVYFLIWRGGTMGGNFTPRQIKERIKYATPWKRQDSLSGISKGRQITGAFPYCACWKKKTACRLRQSRTSLAAILKIFHNTPIAWCMPDCWTRSTEAGKWRTRFLPTAANFSLSWAPFNTPIFYRMLEC